MGREHIQSPARRPCDSCPYRRDVPSGIWDASEYAKLPRYDADTAFQPQGLFQCHQTGEDNARRRICAGWAGCHDGDNLLALRLAVGSGRISPETARMVVEYQSPVPLFRSGAEAASHGMRDITLPSPDALRTLAKIQRTRRDISPAACGPDPSSHDGERRHHDARP